MRVKTLRMALGVSKCPATGKHKISKCPTPGTDKAGKCPAVSRGGGEGGHWTQLELIDALRVQFKYTVRGQGIITYNRNWWEGVCGGGGRSDLP